MQSEQKKYTYLIYTDGGCNVNPGGTGAYAVIATRTADGEEIVLSEAFAPTTNNRMETMALIKAVELLKEGESALIYSDSQYAINTASGIWHGTKNPDLWDKYKKVSRNKTLDFKWVRGHHGNKNNERCDHLCTEKIQNGDVILDEWYVKNTH